MLIDEFVRPVHAVHSGSAQSPASKRDEQRQKRRQMKPDPKQKPQRPSFSMISNLTAEALQFLLQQPRNRLLIEESHELQAGTEMGKYIESKTGQEEEFYQKRASRPAAGHLRPFSYARRLAREVFAGWRLHVATLKEQGVPRRQRRSSSVLLVHDVKVPLQLRERSDTESEEEEEEAGESIFAPLVLDASAFRTAFTVGSLMASRIKAQKLKEEGKTAPSYANVQAVTEVSLQEIPPPPEEESPASEAKSSRRRQAKSNAKGTRWGEDFTSLDDRQRRERLLNDSSYVGFQLHKLRRTQLFQRQLTDTAEIFDSGGPRKLRRKAKFRLEGRFLARSSPGPRRSP
ncbi:unnamed protein product [Effrenium voratum]|uniref:Uncharacterized protein n=1 Tax=Effrenium voratum TaxID=2562239 RepID=A0AA36MM44_9DINO|nr:unnamed protein product [Effrenium voratum]